MDLGLIITVALVALIVVSAFIGFVRGAKKSLFRLITVALSAGLAFTAIIILKSLLGSEALTAKINELLISFGMKNIVDIAASSPLLEEVILKTVGGVIAPILFFLLFIVLSIATYVLYFIITLIFKIASKPKKETESDEETVKNSEENTSSEVTEEANEGDSSDGEKEKAKSGCLGGIFALLFGTLQGVIITAVFVLTVISYTLIVPEISPKLQAADSLNEQQRGTVVELTSTVEKANNAAFISAYRHCGLDFAAHTLMDYKIVRETETLKINTASEIASISELFFVFMDLSGSKLTEYGAEEAALVQKLGVSFTKSEILSLAGAELVHNATESWKNSQPFAGIERPAFGDDLEPMLTKLINIFNESTKSIETFDRDIITVADLVAVFARSGILAASGQIQENPNALFDCLAADGVISDITLTLNVNPRMGTLVPEITNLGLKTLANSLGIAANTTEIYNEAITNIAAHVKNTAGETDAIKRAEALKPLLKAEFDNIGVSVEPEYIEDLATALIEDFGNLDGEIPPEYISEFFDIYSNTVTTNAIPTSGGVSSTVPLNAGGEKTYTFPKYANGMNAETGASKAARKSLERIETAAEDKKALFSTSSNLLSGMRSSATATIHRATVEDFLVSSDCVITNPEAESAALESIVKEVVAIMDALKAPENNGIETIKNFSTRLGGALDSLSKTQMYGADKTFTLFEGILQSKTLRDTTKIKVSETIKLTDKHREKADTVTFGSLMNTLTSTVDVMTSMQNNNISTDSIEGLIENLTPDTAEIMKEVITTERIEELGIPKENAETTTQLMGDLFDNLGSIENPEQFETEAKAVENIINIAIAAKDTIAGNNNGGSGSGEGSGSGSEGGGSGSSTPTAPKKNLFTPTVTVTPPAPEGGSGGGEGGSGNEGGSSEGGNSGEAESAPVEEGTLGCTADEMVSNIMSSSAVCDTIVNTAKENEEGDPFGIGSSLTEEDETALKNACDTYLADAQNSNKSEEEIAKITETLESINKLLGTNWTAANLPIPTP